LIYKFLKTAQPRIVEMDHNLGMKDYAVLVDRIHKTENYVSHRIQDLEFPRGHSILSTGNLAGS
jgi:hypothetical protein